MDVNTPMTEENPDDNTDDSSNPGYHGGRPPSVTIDEMAKWIVEQSPEPVVMRQLDERYDLDASTIFRRLMSAQPYEWNGYVSRRGRGAYVIRTMRASSRARVWWAEKKDEMHDRPGPETAPTDATPEAVIEYVTRASPRPVTLTEMQEHFGVHYPTLAPIVWGALDDVYDGRLLHAKQVGHDAIVWWVEDAPDFVAEGGDVDPEDVQYQVRGTVADYNRVQSLEAEDGSVRVTFAPGVDAAHVNRVANRFDALGLSVRILGDGDVRATNQNGGRLVADEEQFGYETVRDVFETSEGDETHTAPPLEAGTKIRGRYSNTIQKEVGVYEGTVKRIERDGENYHLLYTDTTTSETPRMAVFSPDGSLVVKSPSRGAWRRISETDKPATMSRVLEETEQYEVVVSR